MRRKKKPPPPAEVSQEFQWESTDDKTPILKHDMLDGPDSGESKQDCFEMDQEMVHKEIKPEQKELQEQETALVEIELEAEEEERLQSDPSTDANPEKQKKHRPPRLSFDSSQEQV